MVLWWRTVGSPVCPRLFSMQKKQNSLSSTRVDASLVRVRFRARGVGLLVDAACLIGARGSAR